MIWETKEKVTLGLLKVTKLSAKYFGHMVRNKPMKKAVVKQKPMKR